MPAADPQVAQLCARGWRIIEESFGAELQITPEVRQQLARIDTPDLGIRPELELLSIGCGRVV